MKLYMKQKVFSFVDSFTIKDAEGNDRWQVEGELLSLDHSLHILDMNGNEVALVKKKIFSLFPKFFIYINNIEMTQLVKEFTLFSQSYYLEGTSWALKGDFLSHDYTLSDDYRSIMNITKEWFTWGDSYMLDISEPKDELMCLCIVLAVDCANEQSRR